MYRRLTTLIAATGLTAGIALLLTLGTVMPSATRVSADECPGETVPIVDVDGESRCVALTEGETTPGPTPTPPPPPTLTPTKFPSPAPEEPATTPPAEPAPSAGPQSTPAVVPPSATAGAPSEAPPAKNVDPAPTSAPAPGERAGTTNEPENTSTPTPAMMPTEPPVNADITGVIVPGNGPRLLWGVAVGASASGLLAALVAFYLVSVRPFFIARRRPGALG